MQATEEASRTGRSWVLPFWNLSSSAHHGLSPGATSHCETLSGAFAVLCLSFPMAVGRTPELPLGQAEQPVMGERHSPTPPPPVPCPATTYSPACLAAHG